MNGEAPPCEAKMVRDTDHLFLPQSEQMTKLRLDRLNDLKLNSGYIKYAVIPRIILERNHYIMNRGCFGVKGYKRSFPSLLYFPIMSRHFLSGKRCSCPKGMKGYTVGQWTQHSILAGLGSGVSSSHTQLYMESNAWCAAGPWELAFPVP